MTGGNFWSNNYIEYESNGDENKILSIEEHLKDTHRDKAPPNNTPALVKSSNMGIWIVGTSNQLFIRGS